MALEHNQRRDEKCNPYRISTQAMEPALRWMQLNIIDEICGFKASS
jgi:hypothetical protein